jgi:hypothetical protein
MHYLYFYSKVLVRFFFPDTSSFLFLNIDLLVLDTSMAESEGNMMRNSF